MTARVKIFLRKYMISILSIVFSLVVIFGFYYFRLAILSFGPSPVVQSSDQFEIKEASASAIVPPTPTSIQKKNVPTITPIVVKPTPNQNVVIQNSAPAGGYSSQQIQTDAGIFSVNIVAADINSTRAIVDTASDSDCANNCPVLPLAVYVARNGAFAGINGTYFCPTAYPACAGKTNSFDLLVMNKNKTYFNSDNNVYSNNPAVIFGSSYIRFITAASQWGRDTSPDGVLSNFPLLVFNGSIMFAGDGDPKKTSKSDRSFVANKGNILYIGVVRRATVAESAKVLQALGMDNGLNLDNGGSVALWYGAYKVGPGRDIPNAILLIRK